MKQLSVLVAASALAGCAATTATVPVPVATPVATPAASEHDRLFKLFSDDDEATIRLSPISAIYRGDLRYADQFGDGITDAYYAKLKALAEDDLARLHGVDRSRLNATDQIAYDVFEYAEKDALESYQPQYLDLTKVRPLTVGGRCRGGPRDCQERLQ